MRNYFHTILILLLCVFLQACKKDFKVPEKTTTPTKPTSTKELIVSSSFTWATISNLIVDISPAKSGLFMIKNDKAEVLYKGFAKAGIKHSVSITLPKNTEKLILYFNGGKEEFTIGSSSRISSSLK